MAPAAPEVVAVGASTGGPDALAAFLRGFGTCGLPCVIAQHMPVGLAPELAAALQRGLGRAVCVAEDGMALPAGTVALLPGGMDGALVRRPGGLAVRMLAGGPCVHPSVDVLFRSVAAAARGALGVVLTGMGRDGAEGAAAMAAQGIPILAQSPESCVVGGMPRAVIEAGLAAEADTPEALGTKVAALAASMRTSAP
jgi:two-component system, chemotaxis family, protein-glutamate methylesterase/glutaminase